jgi:hypothetical protein
MLVEMVEQGGEHLGPRAIPTPAVEAVVDGLPRAIARGNVAPGGAGVQAPEETVEQAAVRLPRVPALAVVMQVRKETRDAFPLSGLEFVATTHGWPPFGNLPAGQRGSQVL